MQDTDNIKKSENTDETPDDEVYDFLEVNDKEIILGINKRKNENKALKKLLENLNTSTAEKKTNKKSNT